MNAASWRYQAITFWKSLSSLIVVTVLPYLIFIPKEGEEEDFCREMNFE